MRKKGWPLLWSIFDTSPTSGWQMGGGGERETQVVEDIEIEINFNCSVSTTQE